MKILFIINSLKLAGAEVMLANMCVKLVTKGHAVRVHTLTKGDSNLTSFMVSAGVMLSGGLMNSPYSPRHYFDLCRVLLEDKYDVVHVHLFPAQLWLAFAVSTVPCKGLVTTEHSTHNRRRNKVYLKSLDKFIYRKYSHIICISDAVKRSLDNWIPFCQSRSCVVNNGIDLSKFKSSRVEKFGLDNSLMKVITVGRLEEVKNVSVAIHAIKVLTGCTLTIVGDGPLRQELTELAKKLGVNERVEFLGRRFDVADLLNSSDIYIQTSRWEGFGIAAVEAMACGLPVIVSDVPGLADVVGSAGLTFPNGDYLALARQLEKLFVDHVLRNQMSTASIARAATYSIEAAVTNHLELYRMLN